MEKLGYINYYLNLSEHQKQVLRRACTEHDYQSEEFKKIASRKRSWIEQADARLSASECGTDRHFLVSTDDGTKKHRYHIWARNAKHARVIAECAIECRVTFIEEEYFD